MNEYEYAVIYESGPNNRSAYVPDLPGCVTTGATKEATEHNIREAIRLHLDGMREDGLPVPEPTCAAGQVRVAA